jgi:hypothetical protein
VVAQRTDSFDDPRAPNSEIERQLSEDYTSWEHFRAAAPDLSDTDIQVGAMDLLRVGLLGDFDQGGYNQPGETYRFRLTHTGRVFIWFITAPDDHSC